jgi:hypothetical protein
VALFLFGHVPSGEQAGLIGRIGSWLRRDGFFLGTLGTGEPLEEVVDDWLGAPMYFASLGSDAYTPLLHGIGFELVRDEVVAQNEPGHGEVRFRWVLARATD